MPLQGQLEILYNYLRVLNQNPWECFYGLDADKRDRGQDGYGIGLNFGRPINFGNNKLQLKLESDITGSARYSMYYFFRNVMPLKN